MRHTGLKPLLRVAGALTDPTRVRVLMVLREGELCVCELCDILRVTQSTLSTHLRVLRDAGMVDSRREGKWAYYRLSASTPEVLEFLQARFRDSLEGFAPLRADRTRWQKRLALRDAGGCCVGSLPGNVCSKPSKR